jgi:ribosomal protein L10
LEKKGFKILGAYDLSDKNFIDAETVIKIGKLPTREILLGQLVGVLSAPIRMFMYVLNEKSKMVEK